MMLFDTCQKKGQQKQQQQQKQKRKQTKAMQVARDCYRIVCDLHLRQIRTLKSQPLFC